MSNRGPATICLLIVTALAGCLDQETPAATSDEEVQAALAGMDLESPFTIEYPEHQCIAAGIFLHIPLDEAQARLPPGYIAEPAIETYLRGFEAAAPTGLDLTDRAVLLMEPHGCVMAGGMMHAAAWAWLPVRTPAHIEDPAPGFDFYELCYAGAHSMGVHGAAVAVRDEIGVPFCGDDAQASEPYHGHLGWSWKVGVTHGSEDHWGVTVNNAFDAEGRGVQVPGTYRVHHANDAGRLDVTLAHLYGGDIRAEVLYSFDFACSFDPESLPAQITGVTSCLQARQAGLAPIAAMLGVHDMDVTIAWTPA